MGRKRTPGLIKRGNYWHIDKQLFGTRIQESTGSEILAEAERYLAKRVEEIRQAAVFGVRPKRLFKEAASRYVKENQHLSLIADDTSRLEQLNRYIGKLYLEQIHSSSLQPYVEARKAEGRKIKTINMSLALVRRILNLAASEWIDKNGLTWLSHAPKIKLIPLTDARAPYPLSRMEQLRLFKHLPKHLLYMALFKVNTGCREQEVCQLRWEWEVNIPELDTSIFIIPKHIVKNREDRVVILNHTAKKIIERVRGMHSQYVFTYQGTNVKGMNNSAWERARNAANLKQVRVHDLKHTFGRRLRAAGVSFEDRQDLLGHRSGRITTHYSAAELQNLIEAANSVCNPARQQKMVTLLKSSQWLSSHPCNFPTMATSTLAVPAA